MTEASRLTADDLFLMVNLRSRTTGLPMNIWIGPKGHARHAARIKVQMDHREQFDIDNLAVVSVEDDPPQIKEGSLSAADLNRLRRYIGSPPPRAANQNPRPGSDRRYRLRYRRADDGQAHGWMLSMSPASPEPWADPASDAGPTASVCVAAHAGELPKLADTSLYRKLAHDCQPVDLITWNHPTKQVLKKYQVQLVSVELCNAGKYPGLPCEFQI